MSCVKSCKKSRSKSGSQETDWKTSQKTLAESLDRSALGDRGAWTSGLLALAGIRPEDLHAEALESAAGTGISGAALAWTAAFGLAIGTFAWVASAGKVERLQTTIAVPTDHTPDDLTSAASLVETQGRPERQEPILRFAVKEG